MFRGAGRQVLLHQDRAGPAVSCTHNSNQPSHPTLGHKNLLLTFSFTNQRSPSMRV